MSPLVLTALVGVLAPLLTYLGLRRTTSGKASNSDAAVLWSTLNGEMTQLRKRVADQQGEIDALWARVRNCENK